MAMTTPDVLALLGASAAALLWAVFVWKTDTALRDPDHDLAREAASDDLSDTYDFDAE